MKKRHQNLIRMAVLGFILAIASSITYAIPSLVNPNASQAAKDVYSYIYNLKGSGILTGQHNYVQSPAQYTNEVNSITGKYPAVWGNDFAYGTGLDGPTGYRQKMIDEAISQSRSGSLITFTYHQVRPQDAETAGWSSVQGNITAAEYSDLVTNGTSMNNAWKAKIDIIAGYLKQLGDANVPVLFRPYHEMNGGWFWWGKDVHYKDLWIMTYDRLTNYHGLNNLIWVWGPNRNDGSTWAFADVFPGLQYVDIISVDDYATGSSFLQQSDYDAFKTLAQGKPLAIGENGQMPDPTFIKNSRPEYRWFLEWPSTLHTGVNTNSWIQSVYSNSYAVNRSTGTVVVTGVSVSPTTASINVGVTQQLIATVAPSNASNKTVSWSSNDTSVATVSSTGLVTGVVAGSATITLTTQDGGKTATSAITVTTGTVTTVTINDNTIGTGGNQFSYTGTWALSTTGTDKYQSDDHYSLTTNSYYTVKFTGTMVKLYVTKNAHHGIAAVSIDGGSESNVDLYASSVQHQVLIYTSPTLSNASHTVKVRVTGTKNSNSTGYVITADRADVTTGWTVAVNTSSMPLASNFKINVYPNPLSQNGELTIDFGANLEKANVEIFDINGKMLYSRSIENASKMNLMTKDILNKGFYIVKVSDSQSTYNQKFTIK